MAVSQLNDLKVQALRQLGYLDKQLNVNECLFWKTFSNKTEYDDLKKAWLASLGFNKATLVDSYYAYLRSQGYTGSIPDMEWKALISNTLYFSPLSLFQAGEQGAWYDPSDLSTLFQDSAGTTPVTAVEQPVGLMLDKRKGLSRGPEVVLNGGFDSTANWTMPVGNWAISGGLAVATAGTSGHVISTQAVIAGAWYEVQYDWVVTSSAIQATVGSTTLPAHNPGSGHFKGMVRATDTLSFRMYANNANATLDNVSVKLLDGNHCLQATAASRPILQQDGTGRYYLSFDGTDDGMATAGSLSWTGTDKVTVTAGVRKLSDAAANAIIESSVDPNSNTYTWGLIWTANNYSFRSHGDSALIINNSSGQPAPHTGVVTGIGDISGDIVGIRVNGTSFGNVTTDQGTNAAYGTFPLYLGKRGTGAFPMNANFYGLIVRGAASNASQISQTEAYMNAKTGAF